MKTTIETVNGPVIIQCGVRVEHVFGKVQLFLWPSPFHTVMSLPSSKSKHMFL